MAKRGLTVTMIVRDERENLEALLPVVTSEVDDVVVVDTGSTDGTQDVARTWGARLVERVWTDHFAEARNAALERVRTSHVMWLDADERIEAADLKTVRAEALRRGKVGLLLNVVSESPDPDLAGAGRQLRVFPARAEHRFTGRVHEQLQGSLLATGTPCVPFDVTVRHGGLASEEIAAAKDRRNLELCRLEWESGNHGAASGWQYAKAAARCGEREEAARIARTIVEARPAGDADIVQDLRVMLGRLEEQLGQRAQAERTYREAVTADANDAFPRLCLGELLLDDGRLAEAEEQLRLARTMPAGGGGRVPRPEAGIRRAARNAHGRALEARRKWAEAAETWRKALAEDADDGEAVRGLAEAEFRLGRDPESEAQWRRIALATPDDATAVLRLGQIAMRTDREPVARPLLARALGAWDAKLRAGGPDARVLGRLAECYLALGETAAARVGWEEALKLVPGWREAEEGLAAIASASTPGVVPTAAPA